MSIEKALKTFGERVQKQARANLTRKPNNNASGNLYKKTKYDLSVSKNSFSLSFELTDYWKFQDEGVSGTEKKYNTQFSYKEGGNENKPSPKHFIKWAKQRGIKPRNKKTGKFITDSAFGFAISNHIYKNGIKPTKFFSKPFENEFKKLPDELVEAFSLQLDDLLKFATT
tara:strand:+ start:3102 stop:3611 length:510 start_codon:yes stop_codon:yes gene_type:complete